MADDFLTQSDRDVQRLVEDLEDVIRSPLDSENSMSVKQAKGWDCENDNKKTIREIYLEEKIWEEDSLRNFEFSDFWQI